MIVARHAFGLHYVLILDRWSEDHALVKLLDQGALDLLPGRLTLRVFVAALLFQLEEPRAQLRIIDQHVCRTLLQVDANAIAGLQQRKTAASRGLRRRVEDGGGAGGAGLAAIADAGQRVDAL